MKSLKNQAETDTPGCLILERKFQGGCGICQTSDNIDTWKSRGKSQRREKKQKEGSEQRKINVREKVEKSQTTVLFPLLCGYGGSKSRLLKRLARSHQSRFRSANVKSTSCPMLGTLLEADMSKSASRCGTKRVSKCSAHFWKLICPRVQAVVARSACQNAKDTTPHVRTNSVT